MQPEENKIEQPEVKLQETNTETQEDVNWKSFREVRKKEREEREAALKRAQQKEQEAEALKKALESLIDKPTPQSVSLSDEELLQQKIDAAIRQHREKDQKEWAEREKREFPTKLAQTYPDFEKIVTQENTDYLEYHYPEIAKAFEHMPEGFDKWANVYKSIKKLIPNTNIKHDEERLEKNLMKPKALSSTVTQTGDTAPLMPDDKRREENWKRMQRVIKGLPG